ncbi:MAG: tRNA ((37)-N6)-threonylcarbamoyltransferase complex dimerization subunit type 1 TsaB [Bacteroidota bacterium]|jgi:tRNA threonylcarbamoyladenosine biosynthesis protein TsaB
MPCILNIETATEVCSVAVSCGGTIIFEREETQGPSHASLLGVFVAEALSYVRQKDIRIDAVAVSCGPGSYTGLRIGVSEAKGLCYGLDVPLIAVRTPLVMVNRIVNTMLVDDDTLLCPMIDARRMEVYAALYNKEHDVVRDIAADIVDEHTYADYLISSKVLFCGNGSAKCKEIISHVNALFIDDISPSARHMVQLTEAAFREQRFENLAYFEPFYLKDFVATTPKKNIF